MPLYLINILIKIKNASALKKEVVFCSSNKKIKALLNLFYTEGLIQSYTENSCLKVLKIFLRYPYNRNLLCNMKIVSIPSNKLEFNYKDICFLNNKQIFYFFSTNKGILNCLECKKNKLGGVLYLTC